MNFFRINKINISTVNELYHSIECFQIVRSILSRFHIPLIIKAATDYIDSAKNGQDKSILLAK